MAWASKKQYAIMMQSEEGKDLAEQLPDLEQNEFSQKFGELIGKQGISYDDKDEEYDADYERSWGPQDDEEEVEEVEEVEDWQISEALDDNSWGITQNTTVAQYAQEIADKLGIDKNRVLNVIKNEAPEKIKDDTLMGKLVFGDNYNEEGYWDDEEVEGVANSNEDEAGSPYKEADRQWMKDHIDDNPDMSNKDLMDDILERFSELSPEDEQYVNDLLKNRKGFDNEEEYDAKYNEGVKEIEKAGFKDISTFAHRTLLEYADGKISKEELIKKFDEHERKQHPKKYEER